MPASRCQNGTRRNRKTGICEPKSYKNPHSRSALKKAKFSGYSDADMHRLIEYVIDMELSKSKMLDILHKLHSIEYDPKYIGHFSHNPLPYPFAQGQDRIHAYFKDGDW